VIRQGGMGPTRFGVSQNQQSLHDAAFVRTAQQDIRMINSRRLSNRDRGLERLL
jgi:hypothetical protein